MYKRIVNAISQPLVTLSYPARSITRNASTYFVTTPIYYVNGPPHLGHLYSSLLADSLSRFARLKGKSVVFSTGTDEHGIKVQQSALKAASVDASAAAKDHNYLHTTCVPFTDHISSQFEQLHTAFEVSNTDFIRTTQPRHKLVVEWLWRRLKARGAIYLGSYEGWYCPSDEAFVPESQTTTRREFCLGKDLPIDSLTASQLDQRVASDSGQAVEWLKEDNYRFRLSAYKDELLNWIRGKTHSEADGSATAVIYPPNRTNEVTAWLMSDALTDLSVSRKRSTVPWAIPVPNDNPSDASPPTHSIYVWLDALTNYLTVSADQTLLSTFLAQGCIPDDVDVARLFRHWPADAHVVGKDILRFHAVYWPAFLLAAGLPLPKRIVAHGHWTVGRQKMSKSIGNVIDPLRLIPPDGHWSVDAVRYMLLREGSLTGDGDFSEVALHHRCIAECADTFGNLVSRLLNPKLFPEMMPHTSLTVSQLAEDPYVGSLTKMLVDLPAVVSKHYDSVAIPTALECVMNTISEANRCFTTAEPWKLVKRIDTPQARSQFANLMYVMLETLRICASLLHPTTPAASEKVLSALGFSGAVVWPKDFGTVSLTEYAINFNTAQRLFPKPTLKDQSSTKAGMK